MRVAVTGAHGFIGRHTVATLEAGGHEVVPIDRRAGVDMLDADALDQAMRGCDTVIHLAGVLGTAELFDAADEAIDVNVRGALRVLDVCRTRGVAYVGITMPDCWANLYQATKHAARRIASAYHQSFGVPVTHLRTYNVYGPGQAHGPGHPQKIVPTFATRSWAAQPMPVWGNGQQTVDLVHVDDVAATLAYAATHPEMSGVGDDQVWDCGTGHEIAVLDVARLTATVTGQPFLVEFLPMRPGETPGTRLCASEFGPFTPDIFDLDRFAEVIRSYRTAVEAAA